MRQLGTDTVAATGYCFDGRLVFRHLAAGRGVDIAFSTHPSYPLDEVLEITSPLSLASAEFDPLFPAPRRAEVESLLERTHQPYSSAVYGGTRYGCGTRINVSAPEQKFSKEEAFVQAVRFFKNWA